MLKMTIRILVNVGHVLTMASLVEVCNYQYVLKSFRILSMGVHFSSRILITAHLMITLIVAVKFQSSIKELKGLNSE